MFQKLIICGRLGKDVELKYTQGGTAVANMSVATTRSVKRGNDWEQETTWHNVKVFGKIAENCSKYIGKGSLILIEGTIQNRKYQDQNGQDRFVTEVLAEAVQFIDKKENGTQKHAQSVRQPQEDYPEQYQMQDDCLF